MDGRRQMIEKRHMANGKLSVMCLLSVNLLSVSPWPRLPFAFPKEFYLCCLPSIICHTPSLNCTKLLEEESHFTSIDLHASCR